MKPNHLLTGLAWNLRLSFITEFPGPALNMSRYSWVISSKKPKRELNYQYQYITAKAYRAFAEFVKRR
jgi:hypothetical protein